MLRFISLAFVALLAATSAEASIASVYIGSASAGSDDGTSCANQHAYTFFTTAGNWGAGSTEIGADTVVHLCGNITFGGNATGLTFQGSGTSGHPVTLLFESGASLTSPQFATAGGIAATGRADIVIDGGSNGYIQNTLNGTSGGTCPGGTCNVQADTAGVRVSNCTRCTVQNLTIKNLYVRTSTSDENGDGSGIAKLNGATSLTISNVTISESAYCVFYDLPSGVSDTAFTVQNSTLSHCTTGVAVAGGNGSTGTLAGFVFSGNHVFDFNYWNDPSPPYNFHHDGIHVWSYASTHITGTQVYNNTFDGDIGSGTAWVYYENYSGTTEDVQVFNNLFDETATTCLFSCGPFALWLQNDVASSVIQAKIFNNTFVGGSDSMGGITVEGTTGIQYDLRNNTAQGYANLIQIQPGAPLMLTTSDYNNWYLKTSQLINDENTGGYNQTNIAAWKAHCSCDSHSVFTDPSLNGAFKPQTGSILVGAGVDLTAQSIAAIDTDKALVSRPNGSAWDIGAYQYVAPANSSGVLLPRILRRDPHLRILEQP